MAEYRRKGIQTKLINKCMDFCTNNNITELKLSSDNSDARRIYERIGFKSNDLIMVAKIKSKNEL